MAYYSPLRYPGGKGKLAKYIKLIYQNNTLPGTEYYEVFAGGSGIAIDLLFSGIVQDIHLNDLSKSIASFWHSVIFHTEELCKLIHDVPLTIDEWENQKRIQYNPTNHQALSLELGFSTFYLNRTNRSGILKGGIIGGIAQNGEYQMDARFNKDDLIKRIQKIAMHNDRVHIYNLDAIDFMKEVLSEKSDDGFVYLDPPYYENGQKLYDNFYIHDDHAQLADQIKKIKQNWVVSYDNAQEIRKLYSDCTTTEYDIHYSAQIKYFGKEIMIASKNIFLPESV